MSSELIVMILAALLAISEVLGTFDMFKNSSIFGVIIDIMKKAKDLLSKKA